MIPYQVSVVLDYRKLVDLQPNAGMLDDGTPALTRQRCPRSRFVAS